MPKLDVVLMYCQSSISTKALNTNANSKNKSKAPSNILAALSSTKKSD